MTTQPKEKKMSLEVNQDLPDIKNTHKMRPNIDHLVKRIMIERRKEKKNSIIMMSFVLLAFASLSLFFTKF
jgi:hypothetical protein